MIVFTRVAGQSFRVADIIVLVKSIDEKENTVVLEFDAPNTATILTNEAYEPIRRVQLFDDR